MKPKDGISVLIGNFIVALMLYGTLWMVSIPVEFGHLFIGVILIDVAYYVCKSLEKLREELTLH